MALDCVDLTIKTESGPSSAESPGPSNDGMMDSRTSPAVQSEHDFVLLSNDDDDESIEVLDRESEYGSDIPEEPKTCRAIDEEIEFEDPLAHSSRFEQTKEPEKESSKVEEDTGERDEEKAEVKTGVVLPEVIITEVEESVEESHRQDETESVMLGSTVELQKLESQQEQDELGSTPEQQEVVEAITVGEESHRQDETGSVLLGSTMQLQKVEESLREPDEVGSTAEQHKMVEAIAVGVSNMAVQAELQPTTAIPIIASYSSSDGSEYIRVEQLMPWKVDQLNCSARLTCVDLEIRLHNEGRLLLVDENFVAKVWNFDLNPVIDAPNFQRAKEILFRQLCIVRVLQDELTADRNRSRAGLLTTIKRIQDKSGMDQSYTVDAIQLLEIIQGSEDLNFRSLCEHLRNNSIISAYLREQATQLVKLEDSVMCRNRFLLQFQFQSSEEPSELSQVLEQFRSTVIGNHKKSLLEKSPEYLQNELNNVAEAMLLRINISDLKLFHDMDHALDPIIFKNPLQDLAKRWIKLAQKAKTSGPLTNPVYFSLCRSLEEIILEIATRSHHKKEELLKSDGSGWSPVKTIRWTSPNDFNKCLEHEYKFIMKLLKHFDPASGNTKPFDYQPRRLIDGTISTESGGIFRRLFRRSQAHPVGIADEFYVWYCLLDYVLANVLPTNASKLDAFEHVLQNFVLLITNAVIDQMETIRVITHNTLRFIVQTFPFLDPTNSNSCEDKQILQLQLDAINRLVIGSESTNSFRDLIDVFNKYWENRSTVIENIPTKQAMEHEMEQIKTNLFSIVLIALQKDVSAEHVVDLFRAFNDFLVDLDQVSFDWLIKPVPMFKMNGMIDMKIVEPVETKWSGTDNETYRVINPTKLAKLLSVLMEDGVGAPKNCIVEIITQLLGYITSQLQHSRWTSGRELSDQEQITSASVLISVIRSSLLYLAEYAEYVSYDLFMVESTKPFSNVSENSESLADFTKRIGFIKDSFYYFRKQNEMSFDEALGMFRDLNQRVDSSQESIQQAYRNYTEHFELFMTKTIKEITSAVLASKGNVIFQQWTSQYKQETLPKLLAGIAAVWSIMASKDVSGTNKYLKPHCIQILCVLRLLGSDNAEKGIAKHLAQVLTGQGKSLVLGMIATLLAITGHKIQVVCYNKYLVERDAKDFLELFNAFGVAKIITYSTFDGMANLVIAPEVDGTQVKLRSLVEDLLLSETSKKGLKKPTSQVQANSVMLMDEVDVFFTKDYYGNGYYPIATPVIGGMDKIQEAIWNLVWNEGNRDFQDIVKRISIMIESTEFEGKQEFNKFYNKSGSYDILNYENNVVVRNTYTNKTLFEAQRKEMINDAILVATKPDSHWNNYKLSSKGVITCRYQERFVSFFKVRYYSVFNYFRLKKSDFVPKINSEENYGYLNIRCGALSYAMLPKNFPLILGVTGTLTTLNQHEKETIERLYNIRQSSVMPTFFGCSNIQYNPLEHFHHEPSPTRWLSEIFTRAHAAAIGSKRAVIVFFQDDSSLEKFQSEYAGQFDRLNVLTENTDEAQQEQLITEAGVAKTVTLATRGMGRGVDYKSSVTVEKNGGVHVIQSFFSMDVREETQIRGRTARKDNKGSYELIVCDEHLRDQGLLKAGLEEVSYAVLDAVRTEISNKESRETAEAIQKEFNDHQTTMNYLQSFFK